MTDSTDALAALERLLDASQPSGPANDWSSIEADLGTRLPTSFKRLCDRFGAAELRSVTLFTPQAGRKDSFPTAALAENHILRGARDRQRGEGVPDLRGWRFFPEDGGLLPWARQGSLVAFFEADASVHPDQWRIVSQMEPDAPTANLVVAPERDAAAFLLRMLEADARWDSDEDTADVGTYWARIEEVLDSDCPEALAGLRGGVTEGELDDAEAELGVRLPEPYRQSLVLHDGQEHETPWLVEGGLLCTLADLLHDWREWNAMRDAGDLAGFEIDARPDRGVRSDAWWRRGWLPFVSADGDHLIIDLDPDEGGQPGQIISFSHETGAGCIVAPDFTSWLAIWADELTDGVVRPRPSPHGDDDEQDDELDDEPTSSRTWPR